MGFVSFLLQALHLAIRYIFVLKYKEKQFQSKRELFFSM